MNLVHQLRFLMGLSQQRLADLAGTSQPTIALYESGAKSPSLATIQRMAVSVGVELFATFVPQMTREDQRSLAYHRAVAKHLKEQRTETLKLARKNLRKMKKLHPGVKTLLARWSAWLNLPSEELIDNILSPAMTARDMRQVTPFAGLLSPAERFDVLKRFRKEYVT